MKRTLITSALPYANGYLHLGHCAGAYLPADMYARFLRLNGEGTLYVCGSDEHGVAITIAAEKEKVNPKDIIDKYHESNKSAFEQFGMSFDIYSRTSIPEHHETAREFFEDFLAKGILLEKEDEQFYDPEVKMFLPDRYVEGICPNCGSDGARGDQCDNCGAYYDQLELKQPKSLVSGKTPVVKKTIHWHFEFQKFQKFLESYIEGHSREWKDNVIQQSRSWLKQGLSERAITRDMNWGVKISGLKGVPEEKAAGKVLYVWFEAVLGYISATKEYCKKNNIESKNNINSENKISENKDQWKIWWQDKDTDYIAFIGKDNIVFHTLLFPAMLHARGNGYILPANVPANEFLNLEGRKFSKSKNWSIDLRDFIHDQPELHNIDALRYTLAMNSPETKDADFTWKDYQARNNNELSAIFGNFVNRTLHFVHKNFDGKVPELKGGFIDFADDWKALCEALDNSNGSSPDEKIQNTGDEIKSRFSENDFLMLTSLWAGFRRAGALYRRFRFRDAVTESMNVARAANKYFNDEAPWKTSKTDPDSCAKTLYVCCQVVNSLSYLFAPVVPFASVKIRSMLNQKPYTGLPGESASNHWADACRPELNAGLAINKPELLFINVENKFVDEQVAKLGLQDEAEEDNLITIDDFAKVQLRTAVVLEAEKIKKSKKLLKLQVDDGNGKRQIIAGIAEHYEPEELVGRTVVVVINLKPAKIMGHESNGMLLAANSKGGGLSVISPDRDVKPGAEVR